MEERSQGQIRMGQGQKDTERAWMDAYGDDEALTFAPMVADAAVSVAAAVCVAVVVAVAAAAAACLHLH